MALHLDCHPLATHTRYGMKMTMHINEAILEEVMETYGYETKTDAVNAALNEMVRRHKLREFGKHGLGLTKDELKNCLFPGYDPMALRVAEHPSGYGTDKPTDKNDEDTPGSD